MEDKNIKIMELLKAGEHDKADILIRNASIKTSKCNKCNESKPVIEFYTRGKRAGYGVICKQCQRETFLLSRYNIKESQYNVLLEKQNYVCAICKKPDTAKNGTLRKLSVDHDHNSGIVRGLLCGSCNRAIGNFKDNYEILENAVVYLLSSATK